MKPNVNITVKDNTGEVKAAFKDKIIKSLTECGLIAESHAKIMVPVKTGNLKNSITANVVENEKAVYIGTNVEYASYVELGTSKQSAQPYLKPAVANYVSDYQNVFNKYFKDGSVTLQ